MKQLSLLIFCTTSLFHALFSQTAMDWSWVKSSTSSDSYSHFIDSYIDGSGNMYVIGRYEGASFTLMGQTINNTDVSGYAMGEACISCREHGPSDIFIAKIAFDGELQWLKNLGSKDDDIPFSIIANEQGEVCVTAFTTTSIDYWRKLYYDEEVLAMEPERENIFLIKLNAVGELIEARDLGLVAESGLFSNKAQYMTEDNLYWLFEYTHLNFIDVSFMGETHDRTFYNSSPYYVVINHEEMQLDTLMEFGEKKGDGNVRNIIEEGLFYDGYLYLVGRGTGEGVIYGDFEFDYSLDNRSYIAKFNLEGTTQFLESYGNDRGSDKLTVKDDYLVSVYPGKKKKNLTIEMYNTEGGFLEKVLPPVDLQYYKLADVALKTDTLFIGLNHEEGIAEINGTNYTVEQGCVGLGCEGCVSTYNHDIILLEYNLREYTLEVTPFTGNIFEDGLGRLELYNDNLYMIGTYQGTLQFGETTLQNTNQVKYYESHGCATKAYKDPYFFIAKTNTHRVISGNYGEKENYEWSVYPNPGTGTFSIVSTQPLQFLEIYDLKGKQVFSTSENENIVTNLPEGLYVLKVYHEGGIDFSKIVVR